MISEHICSLRLYSCVFPKIDDVISCFSVKILMYIKPDILS